MSICYKGVLLCMYVLYIIFYFSLWETSNKKISKIYRTEVVNDIILMIFTDDDFIYLCTSHYAIYYYVYYFVFTINFVFINKVIK